jgi:hypothetical protein
MRTRIRIVLVMGMLGSVLAGCASATAGGQSACDQAVAQAMAIDPGSDTVSAVDGAIAGCQSLEAWVSAAGRYPDAFGGQDPTTLATTRCDTSAQLANAPVCTDLSGD